MSWCARAAYWSIALVVVVGLGLGIPLSIVWLNSREVQVHTSVGGLFMLIGLIVAILGFAKPGDLGREMLRKNWAAKKAVPDRTGYGLFGVGSFIGGVASVATGNLEYLVYIILFVLLAVAIVTRWGRFK